MSRSHGMPSGKLTSGNAWKAPRTVPYRLIVLTLAGILALVGVGVVFLRTDSEAPPPPPPAAAEAVALSAVDVAGISTLLGQFATTPHEVRGDITDGTLKVHVTGSVTGDGQSGFGTVNAANIDASTLLAEGITYIKGSPTFWSAMGVQTNWPEWVRISEGFLGDRIYLSSHAIVAALTPIEESRILGDDYSAAHDASATFGPVGLEKISLNGYSVSVLPANDDAIVGQSGPMFGALGVPAELVRNGSVWVVNPPPPPEP
ncbi:MAG: hypothetical protein E6R04_03550 [Spirochaetes bacterium]|nr:MAG: hypothetical protein E6R04_03550 [Spirochaetota bacterium]